MASPSDETALRKRSLTIKTAKSTDLTTSSNGGESRINGDQMREEAPSPPELGEPVSPAGRLFHEPHFNCYIIAIMGSGKPIDYDSAVAGLEATLVRHPRFSSIQVPDERKGGKAELRWARTRVNVSDHVIVPSLRPSSAVSNDQQIEDYISSLSVSGMDRRRPLWEFHLLNLPSAEAAATAVLRVHHSLGDGTSLLSLLLACTRKSSDPSSPPSLPEPPRRSGPVYTRPRPRREEGIGAIVLWLISYAFLAWNTLIDVIRFVATSVFLKDTETEFKGKEGVEFNRKRFVHRSLRLDDVKLIKNAMGCTVNDVLIGVTSAALSRYLYRNYDGEKKKIPKKIRMRSTLLVNIRPTPGVHALAEMMEAGNGGPKYGNHLGYMLLKFPIVKYDDPLDYVREGKSIANRKKSSLEALITFLSGEMVVRLFGIKPAAALCTRVLSNTTLSFSNMVGPVEEICFYGHPMVYLAPSVYGHPHALTVHYQSYMDTMKVVLAVDDTLISDPHDLLNDFAESLNSIKEAAAKLPQK